MGGAYSIIRNLLSEKKEGILEDALKKLFAASSIPTGGLLMLCAYNSSLLQHLNDRGIYLTAAGISLLYVSINELRKS